MCQEKVRKCHGQIVWHESMLPKLLAYVWLHQIVFSVTASHELSFLKNWDLHKLLPTSGGHGGVCEGFAFASGRPPLIKDESLVELRIRGVTGVRSMHLFFSMVKANNLPYVLSAASAYSSPNHPDSGSTWHADGGSKFSKNIGDGKVLNWPEYDVLCYCFVIVDLLGDFWPRLRKDARPLTRRWSLQCPWAGVRHVLHLLPRPGRPLSS